MQDRNPNFTSQLNKNSINSKITNKPQLHKETNKSKSNKEGISNIELILAQKNNEDIQDDIKNRASNKLEGWLEESPWEDSYDRYSTPINQNQRQLKV